jgi:S1-C subfamily serine protease
MSLLQTHHNLPIANLRTRTAHRWRVVWQIAPSIILLVIQVSGQAVPISKTIDTAKKTVVPIVCLVHDMADNNVTRFRIIGTGFIVDSKGTFVTANHVVMDLLASPNREVCKPAITFPTQGWQRVQQNVDWRSFDAGNCEGNLAFDVAVCRTINDLSKDKLIFEVASISTEKPTDGTSIFFTGFPLQATDPITSIGAVAGFTAQDGYNTIWIDKNAWPGASGSPIFLADQNKVIGMILRTGTGDASGLSFGVSGEKISAILSNAIGKWQKMEEDKKQTQPPPKP